MELAEKRAALLRQRNFRTDDQESAIDGTGSDARDLNRIMRYVAGLTEPHAQVITSHWINGSLVRQAEMAGMITFRDRHPEATGQELVDLYEKYMTTIESVLP